MKRLYITFITIAVLGISAGIFYLTVVRPGSVDLPDDVIMETAFDGEYSFGDTPKKIRLIEFMYTNCPDVCPTTSLKMNQVRKKLEQEGVFGKEVEFLTITIDPERDTKETLQQYAGHFDIQNDDSGWYFLRGPDKDVKKIADPFQFMYRDPGTGNFVHTTFTYLIDEDDHQLESFTMGEGFNVDRVYKRIMNEIK